MKSKHSNHMATFPMHQTSIGKGQLDDVKDVFDRGASESTAGEVLAGVIYQMLKSRFTAEYSWEGLDVEAFVPGLMSLAGEMATSALQGMDTRLKRFFTPEAGDFFVDSICDCGHEVNRLFVASEKFRNKALPKRGAADALRQAQDIEDAALNALAKTVSEKKAAARHQA
jgi:hypothetical protein